MKFNNSKEPEPLFNKIFKKFSRLRHHYRKRAWRPNSSSCLITICTIVIIPFLNSLPSEIVIFDNAIEHNVQVINVKYEVEKSPR